MGLDREKIKADAILFITNGQLDKALVEYQKLVVLEAGSPDVHYELAELYEKLNDKEKASQEYLRSARIYERAKELQRALELYERASSLNPRQKELIKKVDELKSRLSEAKNGGAEVERPRSAADAEAKVKEPKIQKEEEEIEIGLVSREEINIPLFSELNEKELQEILAIAERRSFKRDEIILNEGEAGDSIYFIIAGEVGVFKKVGNDSVWLNTLRDGDFFGEFAYFSGLKRQASVIATVDTEVLELKREGLDLLCEGYPNLVKVLTNFYKARVLDTVVGLTPIFSSLQPHQRQKLVSRFELSVVPRGEVIIDEGKEGTGLYLIKNGRVKIVMRGKDGEDILIGFLKEFDFFGEVSLFMGVPTTASVIADTEVKLMKLSKESFQWLLDEFPFIKKKIKEFVEERAENTIGTILKLLESKGLVAQV